MEQKIEAALNKGLFVVLVFLALVGFASKSHAKTNISSLNVELTCQQNGAIGKFIFVIQNGNVIQHYSTMEGFAPINVMRPNNRHVVIDDNAILRISLTEYVKGNPTKYTSYQIQKKTLWMEIFSYEMNVLTGEWMPIRGVTFPAQCTTNAL